MTRRTSSFIAFLALLLALIAPAAAEPNEPDPPGHHALTSTGILALFDRGFSGSYALAIAQERVAIERQSYRSSRSALLPKLDYTYSRTRNDAELKNDRLLYATNRLQYNGYTGAFSLVQPIVDIPSMYRLRQGKYRVQAAQATWLMTTKQFTFELGASYLALASARSERILQASQRERLIEAENRVMRMVELGEASLIEVSEVRSELAMSDVRAGDADALHDDAEARIRLLLGTGGISVAAMPIDGLAKVLTAEQLPLRYWKQRMTEQNAELNALRDGVRVAQMSAKEQSGRSAPIVSLIARRVTSSSVDEQRVGDSTDTATVGLELRIPLFAGGSISAERQRALHLVTESELKLASRALELESEISTAYRDLTLGNERLKAASLFLSAAETRLRATRAGSRAGERTLLDILAADTQLTQARREVVRQLERTGVAWLRLRFAAGTLDRNDIATLDHYMSREGAL